ncbi:tetratricopeptide repeat protein [Microbacterium sp. ARD32]|uniref:tetratricopeptide repeat protein n=1 Tax=Microbacterium sp. ARD32 TaxID=2962577 RepID=UPI002882CB2A|nr:tetratricopeptide repeat protein [Microbacterium sp. ARD32]MDT0157472.1 tetratricopeptide repeat protein [Microbacterium sp. ARD32]
MTDVSDDWQRRVDAVWQDGGLDDDARVDPIDELAGELGREHPIALFECAGARDSAGRELEAEPLYRAALEAGLDPVRRTRAVIQLASTIRNLGKIDEALDLLGDEYVATRGGEMADEAAAFYALALASSGDAMRAASIALGALAPHLTRYTRSVTGYAAELVNPRGE